jgi:hypothetical protein
MVLFCSGFFVSSKSTLVAKRFFPGFLCCVQVSSRFFGGLLVVSILIYFLYNFWRVVEVRSIVVLSWQ